VLKRYHITVGATTTAGGTVTSAGSMMSVGGAKIALEGDEVSCPSCNSKGVIKIDGARRNERFNNRHLALSDDLCICKCSPPPRLVSNQTQRYQFVGAASSMSLAPSAAPSWAQPVQASKSKAEPDDEAAIRLLHPESREPFRRRPYKLELTDKLIEGITDDEGCTQALSALERASLVA